MRLFLLSALCVFCFIHFVRAQCGGGPDQCLGSQSFTVNPAPINGVYNGGTVVTFCYTIEDYNQCNANWLQTIDLNFGPGWDASTITPISMPVGCDGMGNWGYYLTSTSVNSGQTFAPCFAYDTPSGSPGNMLDGIPGNNFGDNCTTYIWSFCFSVQVAMGCNGQSLSMDATAVGDGTGGAWTFDVCPGIPFNMCNAVCSSCKLKVSDSFVNPSCADNDGTITLFPDSAFGGVTYSWQPGGQTTETATGLSSGTYIGTVTDSIGCAVSDTVTIKYFNPVQLTTNKTNAQCYGYCNGTAFIFPSGGISPYSYSWNNGATTSFDTALCVGTYYATVTDSNSCTVIDTIVITEPTKIILSTSQVNASCFGSHDGSATVTATGGSGVYFYFWQPSNQLTATATGLGAITYTIHVEDTKGCFADTTVTITSPPQIQMNPVITNASCYGFDDGSIMTYVSNGVAPYQYLWISTGSTLSYAMNLPAGIYLLQVTDANGCIELDSMEVSQPDTLSGTFEVIPASCAGASDGSITINPAGGTSPYAFEWNNNASLNASGLYMQGESLNTVKITDDNNCAIILSDSVPALPDLIADAGRDTSINLGTSAHLEAKISRAGIFEYDWSRGYHLTDSIAAITEAYPYYTTTYDVKITEISSGCHDDDSVVVKILPSDYILFPTAFTPNSDGLNDVFVPIYGELIEIETFSIFNRWGNVVFSDKTQGWDGTFNGKPEEVGSYVYEVRYLVEGLNTVFTKKGSVLLVR